MVDHLLKLDSPSHNDTCTINMPSWEKAILFASVILPFRSTTPPPWKNEWPLHLNKVESHSPRNVFCQVWLKLAKWFWIKVFKKLSMSFRYFVIIPSWKMAGSFIWATLNPFTKGYFVPSLVEIGPVVLEKISSIYSQIAHDYVKPPLTIKPLYLWLMVGVGYTT